MAADEASACQAARAIQSRTIASTVFITLIGWHAEPEPNGFDYIPIYLGSALKLEERLPQHTLTEDGFEVPRYLFDRCIPLRKKHPTSSCHINGRVSAAAAHDRTGRPRL